MTINKEIKEKIFHQDALNHKLFGSGSPKKYQCLYVVPADIKYEISPWDPLFQKSILGSLKNGEDNAYLVGPENLVSC
jgi:hypothetical protein